MCRLTAAAGGSLLQQEDQPRGAQEHKKGDDRAVEQPEPRLFGPVRRNERGMKEIHTALSVHIERNFSHAGLAASRGPISVVKPGDLLWNKTVRGFDTKTAGAREVHAGCPKNRRRRLNMDWAKRS